MSMKSLSALAMIIAATSTVAPSGEDIASRIGRNKNLRPPNGTKEYFFNAQGEFSTDRMLRSEVVFSCFAINDKSAIKKFNKNFKR